MACIQITDIFYTDVFININSKKLITIELIYDISRAWAFVYYGIGFFVNISFNRLFRKNLSILLNFRKSNTVLNLNHSETPETRRFIQAQYF